MLIDEVKVVNYAGGIERVMCNFANEFVKRGYDVSFVCLDTEEGKPLYFLDNSVKFINLAFLGEEYINIKYYLKKYRKFNMLAVKLCEIFNVFKLTILE